jgi:Ca2+/H+ antiporter
MSWAALILIVVMAIAGSKFTRHSLTVLAALASIGALVWFLAVHTNELAGSRPHASLTQGAIR